MFFFLLFASAVIYFASPKAAACLEVFIFFFFCYKLLSFFSLSCVYFVNAKSVGSLSLYTMLYM